jgi:DNA-binding LacI/PurR family transcriptional regulator
LEVNFLSNSTKIEAAPTKGYYVSSSVNNIMVLLDIFSPCCTNACKYKKLNFIFPLDSEHPRGGIQYYEQFCKENHIKSNLVKRHVQESDMVKGEANLIVSHEDLIEAIKICKNKGWKLGEDIGIVTFNDAPMMEVIENGITSISVDFKQMGALAARFINNNERLQTYVPTKLIVRGSL